MYKNNTKLKERGYRKVGRVITLWEAKEKSPVLRSRYSALKIIFQSSESH